MELRVNLDNPADIHNALVLLNSIRIASNPAPQPAMPDFGVDTLARSAAPVAAEPPAPAAAPLPVAPKPPAPAPAAVPEPVDEGVVATAKGIVSTLSDPPLPFTPPIPPIPPIPPVPAAQDPNQPIKRGRGRPRRNPTADAMSAPVGAVLAGMPARDLAAALGEDEKTVTELVTVDDLAAAMGLQDDVAVAEEPVPAEPAIVSVVDEDFAALRGLTAVAEPDVPAEPENEPEPAPDDEDETEANDEDEDEDEDEDAAAAFSDDELFADPTPPPIAEPPGDKYDSMNRAELELAWREEGGRRANIHWMRNLIQSVNARGPADLTREVLMEALRNPEKYMPPKAA